MSATTFAWIDAKDLKRAGVPFTASKRPSTCHRCGGAGYFPTPHHGACFRCGGAKVDPRYTDTVFHFASDADAAAAAALDKAALDAERAKYEKYLVESAAAEAAHAAENVAYWTADADVAALLAARTAGKTFGEKVAFSLDQLMSGNFGNDKTGHYVARACRFAASQLAEDAKALAAGAACPVGRVVVEGKIVTTKESVGQYGTTMKCLLVNEAGWKVWGTLPAGCDKGDRVRFTATVEAKPGDALFGFYKRPAKVCRLNEDGTPWVAPVEVEA